MDVAKETTEFPVVVALALTVRDPLFYVKDPIANNTAVIFAVAETTYSTLESAIKQIVEEEKSRSWKFIDWTRYSILPVDIRARCCQHGSSCPVEQLLTTNQDVNEALSAIQASQSGDHLVVTVTMYEGDQPPPEYPEEDEAFEVEAQQGGRGCRVCGGEHGFADCPLAEGGIRFEGHGDDYDAYGNDGGAREDSW